MKRVWITVLAAIAALAAFAVWSPAFLLNLVARGADVTVERDIAFGDGERLKLDIYKPAEASGPLPVVVFFYGGSWQRGDKASYRFVGSALARAGIVAVVPNYRLYPLVRYPDFLRDSALVVRWTKDNAGRFGGQRLAAAGYLAVIPDYRLYPQVAFPAFLDDCALAVAWAGEHAGEHGGDAGRLALMGHSAGAYNAVSLATDRRWLGGAKLDPRSDIAGVIGIAGPYDFLPLTDEYLKIIFGPEGERPKTQPINYVDGGEPPLLLMRPQNDRVVDPGNSSRLAQRVNEKGGNAAVITYDRVGHLSILGAFSPLLSFLAPARDDLVATADHGLVDRRHPVERCRDDRRCFDRSRSFPVCMDGICLVAAVADRKIRVGRYALVLRRRDRRRLVGFACAARCRRRHHGAAMARGRTLRDLVSAPRYAHSLPHALGRGRSALRATQERVA